MLWFKSHPGLFWGRLKQPFWHRQVLPGRDLMQHILNRWLWCQWTSQLELLCLHCMRACWISCYISQIIPTSLHTWTLKGHFPFKVCLPLDTLWSLFLCIIFCKFIHRACYWGILNTKLILQPFMCLMKAMRLW